MTTDAEIKYLCAIIIAAFGFCIMFGGTVFCVIAVSGGQCRRAVFGGLCVVASSVIFAHGITLFLDTEYAAWTSECGVSATTYGRAEDVRVATLQQRPCQEGSKMKREFYAEDLKRAGDWYEAHKTHVDALMAGCDKSYPMSGSDISRPELWKAAAWNYFFGK